MSQYMANERHRAVIKYVVKARAHIIARLNEINTLSVDLVLTKQAA